MKTMGITKFKAYALKVIDGVYKNRDAVVITKRGKPVAELVPCGTNKSKPKPGTLAGSLLFEKDIVTPLDKDQWEAAR